MCRHACGMCSFCWCSVLHKNESGLNLFFQPIPSLSCIDVIRDVILWVEQFGTSRWIFNWQIQTEDVTMHDPCMRPTGTQRRTTNLSDIIYDLSYCIIPECSTSTFWSGKQYNKLESAVSFWVRFLVSEILLKHKSTHKSEQNNQRMNFRDFDSKANEAIQSEIHMISGCHDSQTSADVSNVGSFKLPNPQGRAGGACTAALLSTLYECDRNGTLGSTSWVDLLRSMRTNLLNKG